jgi:protein-disulfide isomerase-like protein with CxxC motif
MAELIRFHLDPRCPWCWQTSKWIRQLDRLGVVEVSWGLFSLEVVNFDKPIAEFDAARSVAAPSQRTLVAVRDAEGQAAAGRFYAAIGTRYFDLEQDLAAASTIQGALTDAGLATDYYDRALADWGTWDTVLAEHLDLVDNTASFGVPTIRLDGGTGPVIFGPVISNPPSNDDDAVALWQHVSWLIRYPEFSELKRNRTIDPDLVYYRSFMARRQAEAQAKASQGTK